VRSGALRVVLEDFEPPQRPINIVYPQSRHLPARTRVFIDWMKQALQGIAQAKIGDTAKG
jgi:DNA-binding transcriptional LysR family regulator